jgi:hypothetical protein
MRRFWQSGWQLLNFPIRKRTFRIPQQMRLRLDLRKPFQRILAPFEPHRFVEISQAQAV